MTDDEMIWIGDDEFNPGPCPKCGHKNRPIRYDSSFLESICRRCGYRELHTPLDRKRETEEER